MSEEEKLKYPAVTHPLARTHPDGRRSLYMGGHVSHIDGQPVEEGRAQVAQLTEQVTTDDIVYEHQWQARDLVVWDNRSTLHRLRPYDIANQRRVMRRLTVVGTERVV